MKRKRIIIYTIIVILMILLIALVISFFGKIDSKKPTGYIDIFDITFENNSKSCDCCSNDDCNCKYDNNAQCKCNINNDNIVLSVKSDTDNDIRPQVNTNTNEKIKDNTNINTNRNSNTNTSINTDINTNSITNTSINSNTNTDSYTNTSTNTPIDVNTNTDNNNNIIATPDSDENEEISDSVIVKDNQKVYSQNTKVNIFSHKMYYVKDGVIAPGTENAYQFVVRNNNSETIVYNASFDESNEYNINMKYKLKKGEKYVAGNEEKWISADELAQTNVVLAGKSYDTYTLEWKWVESSNDTMVGKQIDAKYGLSINFLVKQNTN